MYGLRFRVGDPSSKSQVILQNHVGNSRVLKPKSMWDNMILFTNAMNPKIFISRSLIIVKRGGGKEMPNTLVDPSGDSLTSAGLSFVAKILIIFLSRCVLSSLS